MMRYLKLAAKIAVGVILAGLVALAIALVATAVRPARPVGLHVGAAADPGHPAIPVAILYPTTDTPGWTWFGQGMVQLARDGAVDGSGLPMIVISHGTGGAQASHLDTALALVEAGYVVAVPLHPGDNFQDDSRVGSGDWIVDRARHIARVDDYVLSRWPGGGHVDGTRIGLFGYSAGGTTGLVAIGGTPDLAGVAPYCARHREFVCALLPAMPMRVPAASEWTHDPRIRAAVIVAPGLGFAFAPDGLAAARRPVQLWAGAADENAPVATNAGVVRGLLPLAPEYHVVEGAAHFSFMPPCGLMRPLLPHALCTDPDGFDRSAFRAPFNRQVVAFFNRALARP